MPLPVIEYVDCSDPENPVHVKREMTAEEHTEYVARCAVEDARMAAPQPKTAEERIAELEALVASLKAQPEQEE